MEKTIQIKRGNKVNLPTEALDGELLFVRDDKELWVGKGTGESLVKIGQDMTNVVTTDSSGKIDPSVLPPLAISETFTADSESSQLALTVQAGDICVRTDENKSYIALNDSNSSMTDWQELLTPGDAVQSVNGETGVVVLDTDDISEGSNNLYYTDARATAAASTLKLQDLSDVSTTAPSDNQILRYNSANNRYEPEDLSIAQSFLDLTDTEASYTGKAGYQVAVKSDETGLEFVDDSIVDGGLF
jgi:hypothetical protein